MKQRQIKTHDMFMLERETGAVATVPLDCRYHTQRARTFEAKADGDDNSKNELSVKSSTEVCTCVGYHVKAFRHQLVTDRDAVVGPLRVLDSLR